MSDLLEAAAEALGTPAPLVRRSAAARAAANGTTAEEILSAWVGGDAVAAVSADTEPETPAAPETEPEPEPEPEIPAEEPAPAPEPMPSLEPVLVPAAVAVAVEPEIDLEPVPLRQRVRTAVRVGAWVGAGLGLVGILAASMSWAPAAIIPGEGASVVVEVGPTTAMIAFAVVSIVFGAVVASVSRAAASWRDPAMQLSGHSSTTAWVGAGIGLFAGIAGAALLTGTFGTPVGEDGSLVQLPVLGTLVVMIGGGAVLGAVTAAVPQLLGTPVAVSEEEREEAEVIRGRLNATVGIPLAGLVLLAVLVLPFAYALLESNHLTANGAALVAIITAGGILGFAALSGNRPNVRISLGELMVALAGIGTVLLIVLAVLAFRDGGDDHEVEPPETTTSVQLL